MQFITIVQQGCQEKTNKRSLVLEKRCVLSYIIVTTHTVRLPVESLKVERKIFRLKTEGEGLPNSLQPSA
jgi:hypothetical protein